MAGMTTTIPPRWRLLLALLRHLPQGALSRGAGLAADTPIPRRLRAPVLGLFARMVGADPGEAELPLGGYRSVNQFFIRRLAPGARPMPEDPHLAVSPVDGVTSAGQPDQAALEVFADAGYATVIDLRGEGEDRGFDEAAVVEDLGLHYVTLPIEDSDAISFENARKLDALLQEYPGPVLVHCGSGNRVGALLALRASLEGADDERALAVGREGGLTGLESVVQERLAEDDKQ